MGYRRLSDPHGIRFGLGERCAGPSRVQVTRSGAPPGELAEAASPAASRLLLRFMDVFTLLTAFGAGVLSFLSPCVLPLVPGYISFVSGASLSELADGALTGDAVARRRRVIVNTVAFVLGFSIVFVAMGASATYAGQWLAGNRIMLGRIAGTVIVVFGLHVMGVLKIPFLNVEKRFHSSREPVSLLGSFGIGLAFAFGWSPCIGPILAGVLVLAANYETVTQGIILLSAYSLGLGVPFLLTGIAVDRFFALSKKVKRHMRVVEIVAGVLLVVIGVLVFTDSLQALSQYLTFLPVLG